MAPGRHSHPSAPSSWYRRRTSVHIPVPAHRLRFLAVAISAAVCVTSAYSFDLRDPPVVQLLDRYAAGRFDDVVHHFDALSDFQSLLDDLKANGHGWIDAAGPETRVRRRLVAATVALEAARSASSFDWKWIAKQPLMCRPGGGAGGDGTGARVGGRAECYQPPNVLYWRAPPLLIEWACALIAEDSTPDVIERWWHLGALAVAQRSEDVQFLIGDPAIGRGLLAGEIGNTQDEIKHLAHSRKRFPNERRFLLAEGIARERVAASDAIALYDSVKDDRAIGGEALVRLGVLQSLMGRVADAVKALDRAEQTTRDPFLLYLSEYTRGRIAESRRQTGEAKTAYRRAVAAYPNGQSATLALAFLLFRDGSRTEAQGLAGEMLAATLPPDPWREYAHADDRFWPQIVRRLRAEIRK
jgi:tetratricopeptide (TPR) repeat protein